eukprot:m.5047 g.5047  ORF g.5047 m.5047 type:complete len:781 (+) comp2331_c0_seq1:97-2439(+)
MGRKRAARQRQQHAEERKQRALVGNDGKKRNVFAQKKNPGKSIKLRQETLLVEYKKRNKTSNFKDKRFGEGDESLTPEERALMRFARERQHSTRKSSRFNLNMDDDDDDEDSDLKGIEDAFVGRDDYAPSDEEDDGVDHKLTSEEVLNLSKFGGMVNKRSVEDRIRMFDEEEENKKKQAKGNMGIMEQQHALEDLDSEYDKLMATITHESTRAMTEGRVVEPTKDDTMEFDNLVAAISTEKKKQASDPVLSQTEADKQYQKKMEKLERERLRRMQDIDDLERDAKEFDESDYGYEDEESRQTRLARQNKGKTSSSNDDIDGAFVVSLGEEDLLALSLRDLLSKHIFSIPSGAPKFKTLERRFEILCTAIDKHVASSPTDLGILNRATSTLFEFVQLIPRESANYCREWCISLHNQLKAKSFANYPRLNHLIMFQLFPMLFPSSDFRHVVMTPYASLLAYLLASCNVKSLRNICAGLYLVSCAIETQRETHRYMAEAICYLLGVIMLACDGKKDKKAQTKLRAVTLPPFQKLSKDLQNMLFPTDKINNGAKSKLEMSWLQEGVEDGKESKKEQVVEVEKQKSKSKKKKKQTKQEEEDTSEGVAEGSSVNVKFAVVHTALSLLFQTTTIYSDFPAFFDTLAVAVPVLQSLSSNMLFPSHTRGIASKIVAKIEEHTSSTREYMQLQAHKPVPISTLEPDFEEEYFDRRGRKDPKAKRDSDKLKHLFKREKRGAIKELKKDARFLSKVKFQEQRDRDQDRFHVIKQVETLMQQGRAEEKREKGM